MIHTHSSARRAPKAADAPGIARVLMIVGGAFQQLARYPSAAQADIVLHVDVPNELQLARGGKDAIRLALAAGETLGTLIQGGCPEGLKHFAEQRPAIDLGVGLGQLRAIGALAARKILEDPSFERFVRREILDRLLTILNGLLLEIEITICTSVAGGTGGPVGPALAKAIAQILLDHSEAVVHLQFVRVGSFSYIGVGERVHFNGAATLAEDVNYITSCKRHPREVRSLILAEMPITGTNRQRRDGYILQFVQALRAGGVRAILQQREPNAALDSPLGTVSILHAGWWNALPDHLVAADVAAAYQPELRRLLNTPPGLVRGIEVVFPQGEVSHAKTIPEVLETMRQSKGVRPMDFVATCTELRGAYSSAIVKAMVEDRVVDLAAPTPLPLPPVCRTREEFVRKISILRALIQGLEGQVQRRTSEITALQQKRQGAMAQLEKAINRVYPAGFGDRLVSVVSNPGTRLQAFKDSLQRVREIDLKIAALTAEAEALRQVRGKYAADLEAETTRLTRAINALGAVRPAEETLGSQPLLEAANVNVVLEDLLEVSQSGSPEPSELVHLLASAPRAVTLAGLARIAGVAEAKLAVIARQLARGTPPLSSPVWGGKLPQSRGQVITVLPPVSASVEADLRRLLEDLAPDVTVAFADTAEAGVNALRLRVFQARQKDEIITPFLQPYLERAGEQPDLYFTDGFASCRPASDQEQTSQVGASNATPGSRRGGGREV